MPLKNLFVLDTSALLALRAGEPGADRVESLLLQGISRRCQLLVSFITRMELLYRVWREEGEEAAREALRLVNSFAIEWVSCEPDILETASRLKAQGRLSLADCWIGATAIVREATLVHKDPEFARFKEIRQEVLRR
ncbi:MAG: PIN domain-containing protein [Deltaproteobacteria bacterium]|nr:PIN domain-containing protein [Deltaproteobacteria bacterium]